MLQIIATILSAIQDGIPLIDRFTRLFKKKNKTDVTTLSLEQLQEKVNELESSDSEGKLEWTIKTFITLATVYGVIWMAKHFGITSDEILTLMGTINTTK